MTIDIEAAMREPVAKVVTTQTGPEIVRLKDCPLGTRLYAFPPDAQAEIERLRALLSDGREIVAEKLPAYRLWVKDVDAALAGKEPPK